MVLGGAPRDVDAFDPRPLRAAAALSVFFIVAPGSVFGAAMLWVLGNGTSEVPLIPSSTHAILQLAGGFMTLIAAFLAFGVPHLLGLDARKARRVRYPLVVLALALLVDVIGLLTATIPLAIAARAAGTMAALAVSALFASARVAGGSRQSLRAMPLPFLVASLALYPLAWAAYALELVSPTPAGLSSDILLYLVVVPVLMSMGWKMFSAMLQLDAGHAPRLAAAVSAWLVGGVLVVCARGFPSLSPAAAPFLLAGALLWLGSLHGLKRRRRGLALQATAGSELRAHVVVGAASLVLSPALWLVAAATERVALFDVSRHVLAIGFVLAVTMGVTLRALPRFCRGLPSSPWVSLLSLALLVVGLALRSGRALQLDVASEMVRASAVITLGAVVVWGLHLLRGLREVAPARRG